MGDTVSANQTHVHGFGYGFHALPKLIFRATLIQMAIVDNIFLVWLSGLEEAFACVDVLLML